MASIRESLGKRLKLDSVAQATIGAKKMGNGLMAIKWWREGDIASIKKYCKQDVKVTKELFEYALANQKIFYKDGTKKREVLLNTANWVAEKDNSMTFSLPF